MKPKTSFEDWHIQYNRALGTICGMCSDDLDDMPSRRWYEEGVTPLTAAKRTVKWARRGYRPDFAD